MRETSASKPLLLRTIHTEFHLIPWLDFITRACLRSVRWEDEMTMSTGSTLRDHRRWCAAAALAALFVLLASPAVAQPLGNPMDNTAVDGGTVLRFYSSPNAQACRNSLR